MDNSLTLGPAAEGLRGWALVWEYARWVAVLPGALLAWLLAMFPVHWAVLLIKSDPDGEGGTIGLGMLSAETLEYLGIALFGSMALVYAGGRIAPRHHLYAAAGLLLLWVLAVGMLVGASLVLLNTDDRYYIEDSGWVQMVAVTALNLVGAVIGLRAIYSYEREQGG